MELAGKNVLVFGAAVSGISAAETLLAAGARVTLADGKELEKLKQTDGLTGLTGRATLALGRQDEALLDTMDLLLFHREFRFIMRCRRWRYGEKSRSGAKWSWPVDCARPRLSR